jgi:hypothetical protein
MSPFHFTLLPAAGPLFLRVVDVHMYSFALRAERDMYCTWVKPMVHKACSVPTSTGYCMFIYQVTGDWSCGNNKRGILERPTDKMDIMTCWPWHQCNLAYPDAQGTETGKPLSLAYISKARIDDFHSLVYHRGSYKFVDNQLFRIIFQSSQRNYCSHCQIFGWVISVCGQVAYAFQLDNTTERCQI